MTVAEIKAREEAKRTYETALAQGDKAQLLEQKRGDVFQMSIGNIQPNDKCVVKIRWVFMEMRLESCYMFSHMKTLSFTPSPFHSENE